MQTPLRREGEKEEKEEAIKKIKRKRKRNTKKDPNRKNTDDKRNKVKNIGKDLVLLEEIALRKEELSSMNGTRISIRDDSWLVCKINKFKG